MTAQEMEMTVKVLTAPGQYTAAMEQGQATRQANCSA